MKSSEPREVSGVVSVPTLLSLHWASLLVSLQKTKSTFFTKK